MEQFLKRPTIDTEGVGMARNQRYHDAIARYQEAMKNGYYIEATALMESLISDRLDSLLGQICNGDYNDYSLGTRLSDLEACINMKKHSKLESCPGTYLDESGELVKRINEWRKKRNIAIHTMAQLDEDINRPFAADYAKLKEEAEEAYKLFNELTNMIGKLRRGPLKY